MQKHPQMCDITFAEIILFFLILVLCPICRVLMSDILIHLKGCAKTVPLHTTLPANPRYWLGADSKATPVGLCTTQPKVINHKSSERKQTTSHKCHSLPSIHAHGDVIYFMFSMAASTLLH